MTQRMMRVNSMIEHEITRLVSEIVDLKPGVFATIAKVDTLNDFSQTRIFVTVFPTKEKDYVMKTLEHERGLLQKKLHKKLHLKVLPKILFIYSEVGENVDELQDITKSDEF